MDALQFFLRQHARVHSASVAASEAFSFEDLMLSGLTDDEIRLRPRDTLNSVAWLIWHMSRTEDVVANLLMVDRSQVLDEEDWFRRLNVNRRDIGTGMTTAEVSDLSAKVDISALRAYRVAVGRRTREVVQSLQADDLEEVITTSQMRRAISEGAFGPNAGYVASLWPGKTKAYVLGSIPILHNAIHLGEVACVRSEAGRPLTAPSSERR